MGSECGWARDAIGGGWGMNDIKNEQDREIYAALREKYPQGGEMTAEDWKEFTRILDENPVYKTKEETEAFSQYLDEMVKAGEIRIKWDK
ncbi:MAG: hypothetical protein JKY80_07560 [Mariprofundaceae bacterium]|nr:hypothetical protein [Mariprofundaceae bacterium]